MIRTGSKTPFNAPPDEGTRFDGSSKLHFDGICDLLHRWSVTAPAPAGTCPACSHLKELLEQKLTAVGQKITEQGPESAL